MSAITVLQVAIDNVIQGDATLSAKLAGEKVYSLMPPPRDTLFPYIVLGQSTETNAQMFEIQGHVGIETIHVWSDVLTKAVVADIIGDLDRLLDRTRLTLGGGIGFVSGSLDTLAIMADPSGKFVQGVLRYEVLTHGG